jgi:hypothetical protein
MHPLARHLAPLMNGNVDDLRAIVAEWVLQASSDIERARYRRFGAELGAVQRRILARSTPPTEEEVEIALTAVLAISGRRALVAVD